MTSPQFVHLRLHSEYSIVDGLTRYDQAVAQVAEDGQGALALTDLGNGFAWVRFYKAARSKGIKPVLGVDAWVSNDGDRDKPHRLLLLAASETGYRHLCELISRAWLENVWRDRGEMRLEWFAAPGSDGETLSSVGLIALSGFSVGEVGQNLLAGNPTAAQAAAERLSALFPGAFYLEVQRAGFPGDEALVGQTALLASKTGLPLVATHPVQFNTPDQFQAHEARVCIAEGEILANPRRVRRFTPEQYLKTQAEMAALFADLPAALENAVAIGLRCSVSLKLGKPQLPLFPTPEGLSLDDFLRQLAQKGLEERLKHRFPHAEEREKERPRYEARLAFECDTIIQMGFPGYFLIVADFINWAKRNGVPVGPGRGSGAGSLVAYSLGITDLDPLPYALLFERFLNPERVSMPDFDIDFCQDKRYQVIEYVRKTYGAQAVSQIATFGTMASKAVIRDAGRVLDLPYTFCDQLSKLIPVVQNKPLSLDEARKQELILAEREEREDEVRELLALAGPLEDAVRNVGMHAGGVLIAPGKLTDFCPVYQAPGTDAVVSMYDKDDVEAAGLVKFDFLGLRNLTIIQLAVEYVNAVNDDRKASPFDLTQLEAFDDPAAYQILKDANTTAIFQLESQGMKKLLAKLAPDRFEDIIAVLALYRPGPLGSGMVDDFILRKKGQQSIDYYHPALQACLEPTYGVIVYQEQVMQISQIIAGYTLGGADLLRRAMGKKKPEEMAKQRVTFTEGAKTQNYDADLAAHLFDLMEKFAEYGFNKSHTAAYAVVTYQTAWLKAHYPAEFMAATLSADMDDTDKVMLFVEDALVNDVPVLPPDINQSGFRFEPVWTTRAKAHEEKARFRTLSAEEQRKRRTDPSSRPNPDAPIKAIRYGLGAVKGTGESAVQNILKARSQGGPFTSLFDFCLRVDRKIVNRRTIEALVKAGAMDALAEHRSLDRGVILASVSRAIDAAEQACASAHQNSLFGEEAQVTQPMWVSVPPWSDRQRLGEEKIALGFYFSGHLFTPLATEVRRFAPVALAQIQAQREPQWIAGIISAMRQQQTRRGRMLILELDDRSGKLEVSVFSELADAKRHRIRPDELVVVQARVENDDYSGGMRATAQSVLDLGEARAQFAKGMRLKLSPHSDLDAVLDLMRQVRVVAPDTPGCPVKIDYLGNAARCAIDLPGQWRLPADDDVLRQLRGLLGAAELEY